MDTGHCPGCVTRLSDDQLSGSSFRLPATHHAVRSAESTIRIRRES